MEASTDPAAVAGADVVLFCVKGVNNEAASRSIAPHLAADAIVVSLQNGVDNVETIRAASGIDALPAVVYIAAALPEPGHVKHLGRGELAIGELTSSAGSVIGIFAVSAHGKNCRAFSVRGRALPHLGVHRR